MILTIILINVGYNKVYWKDFFSFAQNDYWGEIIEKLPMLVFMLACPVIAWISYKRKLSVIPVLGLLSCLFLMTKLGHTNWLRFLIWLGTGLLVYFGFSRKNSRLNR